ncbi:Flp pilus assembly complex ATPase component TadA [Clostridium algidicarnis]|uniref:Flp pilus assembly complex ATPase component TadA n=2 Tax=Clostridium algidicarnis TaxID=37659 RepID=A0ABS6C5M3_9CLOT|nr:GspE/PulE family protein [Clostridium algidicarnis]MBU3220785.1 Flp pilus assembly complex ATPase component TadA [Clostridium algidicarnis]
MAMDGVLKRRLGDLLVGAGKITNFQLQESLKKQRISGKKIGEVLIEEGIVTVEDILEVLEKQTGIERVNLELLTIDKKAIKLVPQSMCTKNDLVPFGFNENKIKVAMWDPLNIFAVDDIAIASGFQVEIYLSTKEEIRRTIERCYSDEQVFKAAEELSKEKQGDAKNQSSIEESFDDIKNAPVVKMIDYLIKNAIEQRASDIHIEPYEKIVRIRYRVDGQLQYVSTLPIDSLPSIVTRIKIMANLNIAEKRVPQDGRIITKVGNKDIDLRVSILPMINGEKVVIRVLSRENYEIGKDRLGMTEEELGKLQNIIKSTYGIILVTGPTGSGKSTTLYTTLKELNDEGKNIITIEDPVEYTMDGINQVNVNTKSGLTFANGLRSILRQDPDIVMVGEIRDSETAQIAVRAAITGHLVLSTLHTNDAPSSVVRLVDMGIEPYLVSTSISGVIAQRLVKKICPKCKKDYLASEQEKIILGLDIEEDVVIYKGEGCAFCNNTGYMGRTGVYEIMEISRKHKEAILNSKSPDEIRDLSIKNGMKTLGVSCKEMVLKGVTTVEELVKIAYLKE